jgi:hypothetical protein
MHVRPENASAYPGSESLKSGVDAGPGFRRGRGTVISRIGDHKPAAPAAKHRRLKW